MDMDGGNVGTGAARLCTGDGGSSDPAADGGVIRRARATPSTSHFEGGRGYILNGTTASPAQATVFAKAALASSFCSIPPGGVSLGGHMVSRDSQQSRRHAVYAYAATTGSWGKDDVRHDPWQALGRGVEDTREKRTETAGRDGGSAGTKSTGNEISTKRWAEMDALELELLNRAQSAKRMKIKMAPLPPEIDGLVFPPAPRDLTHLRQDNKRDEVMQSIPTNPGTLVESSVKSSEAPITAIRRRRRDMNTQQKNSSSPVKNSEEQHHSPAREKPSVMSQRPSRSGSQQVEGPTIPKTRRRKVGRQCQHPNCSRVPTFGPKGGARKTSHCAMHKHEGMVRITSRRCAENACLTAPSYGFEGKRASFCSKHKKAGMINVVTRRCQKDGCASCASFGYMEDRRPLFCARHAHGGMSNVVNRKCLGVGCTTSPSYGHPGDRRASFCVKHHLPGMSNIVSPKCRAPGCRKAPSFGESGDLKASWCKSHKRAGMVNTWYSRQLKKKG
eukprot:g18777.t1